MSESREQFRRRIWGVFEKCQYTYPEVAQSLSAHTAAAEAVYAAALRDVIDDINARSNDERMHRVAAGVAVLNIERFAAEHGIDLEDTP